MKTDHLVWIETLDKDSQLLCKAAIDTALTDIALEIAYYTKRHRNASRMEYNHYIKKIFAEYGIEFKRYQ